MVLDSGNAYEAETMSAMRNVFIVAQYKCGTSWLLAALSAHPDVLGIREIDIVKATFDWRQGHHLAESEHRTKAFFGSSAWCPDDIGAGIESGSHDSDRPSSRNHRRPQSYKDLEPETVRKLYREIRDADEPDDVVNGFLSAVASGATDQSHLVLKAADQIAVLDLLDRVQPNSPKIAITRDGRDAAISAMHYKKLVENQPWFSGHASYSDLLAGWADRATLLAEAARAGRVFVIRYEDLTNDYESTFGGLLRWLDLDHSESLVHDINERTSFEAMTGRPRGSDGTGVIRKGGIGEWRDTLSADQADASWQSASDALTSLGYTRNGEYEPMPGFFSRVEPTRP